MASLRSRFSLAEGRRLHTVSGRRPIPTVKKPLPDPATFAQVTMMLILHCCRRIVLIDPEVKIGAYFFAIGFGSLVTDFFPLPRSYFAMKSNIFNSYFVKFGWGWTLSLVGCFVYLTSWTYCCGNKSRVKKHMCRLLVGTAVWFILTSLFTCIEMWTSGCTNEKYNTRALCLKNKYRWVGFDISGHSFLLIYCALFIMEETKCIRGWERISELLRNYEFDDDNPLNSLTEEDRTHLKEAYKSYTFYIKILFVLLTFLLLLWDVMLVCTILYFHTMVQKMSGGILAVVMWFVTYRWWYYSESSPGFPGDGLFKYCDIRTSRYRKFS